MSNSISLRAASEICLTSRPEWVWPGWAWPPRDHSCRGACGGLRKNWLLRSIFGCNSLLQLSASENRVREGCPQPLQAPFSMAEAPRVSPLFSGQPRGPDLSTQVPGSLGLEFDTPVLKWLWETHSLDKDYIYGKSKMHIPKFQVKNLW